MAAQRRIMQAKGLDPMEDMDGDDALDSLSLADPLDAADAAGGVVEVNNRSQSEEITVEVEETETVQVETTETLVTTSETKVSVYANNNVNTNSEIRTMRNLFLVWSNNTCRGSPTSFVLQVILAFNLQR